MKNLRLAVIYGILILFIIPVSGGITNTQNKLVYVPSSFGNMDLNSEASQWCYQRSRESDNFIVFWESGYGTNPDTHSNSNYRVDVDAILDIAETSFSMYRDSLKFIIEGNSKTDTYKMIILLFYTSDWIASGSGVDDMIGQLNLSASGAQALGVTVAHEVGHCFQYQVHCDGHQGGWMYGFGPNGSGGNGWWEQCAQWQAYKVFPERQFTEYNFGNYLKWAHKNLLHEEPRYANYFIHDYWTYLHGMNFIGRLWRDSKYPEDPVEAYKRITGISQSKFNDQIYDYAARAVTWDIPALKPYGKNYIDSRASSSMMEDEDEYWRIDPEKCVENYGYNVLRLNKPEEGKVLKVYFEGIAGDERYSKAKSQVYAGWRFGIVSLRNDGTRTYSEMRAPSYAGSLGNPKDTLLFETPENTEKLWLVVSGAPFTHWRHAWDDDDSNDEQWPYRIKLENTNFYGVFNFGEDEVPHNDTLHYDVTIAPVTANSNPYPSIPVQPDLESLCRAFKLNLSQVKSNYGAGIRFCAVNPNGTINYNSTANAPGHWFGNSGYVTNWGSSSYIFSEFNPESLSFNIGQYPNRCREGDEFTIRQALVYTPAGGNPVRVDFEFNIYISSETTTSVEDRMYDSPKLPVVANIVHDVLYLTKNVEEVTIFNLNGQMLKRASDVKSIHLESLKNGIYIVKTENAVGKIIKVAR